MKYTFKAWNVWRSGKTVSQLRINSTDPEIERPK